MLYIKSLCQVLKLITIFYPGLDITPNCEAFAFEYGETGFGPEVEVRTLNAIRKSLLDPDCDGPQKVYSIAMDEKRRAF